MLFSLLSGGAGTVCGLVLGRPAPSLHDLPDGESLLHKTYVVPQHAQTGGEIRPR